MADWAEATASGYRGINSPLRTAGRTVSQTAGAQISGIAGWHCCASVYRPVRQSVIQPGGARPWLAVRSIKVRLTSCGQHFIITKQSHRRHCIKALKTITHLPVMVGSVMS